MLKTLLGTAVALLLSGCHVGSVATSATRHDAKSIELDHAEVARVDLRMGAGELRVNSGTAKLLEAEFAYNVPEWKPVVDDRGGPSGGDLTISQPRSFGTLEKRDGVWINPERIHAPVTVRLDVKGGVGKIRLVRR